MRTRPGGGAEPTSTLGYADGRNKTDHSQPWERMKSQSHADLPGGRRSPASKVQPESPTEQPRVASPPLDGARADQRGSTDIIGGQGREVKSGAQESTDTHGPKNPNILMQPGDELDPEIRSLKLYRFEKRKAWLLTGWKEKGPDEPGGSPAPSGPTHAGPTLNRPGGGAGPGSILGSDHGRNKTAHPGQWEFKKNQSQTGPAGGRVAPVSVSSPESLESSPRATSPSRGGARSEQPGSTDIIGEAGGKIKSARGWQCRQVPGADVANGNGGPNPLPDPLACAQSEGGHKYHKVPGRISCTPEQGPLVFGK